jgi:hypothetical protein
MDARKGSSPFHRLSISCQGGLVTRNAAFLTFILLTTSAVFAQVLSSTDVAKKLHALFDEDWQWGLEQ